MEAKEEDKEPKAEQAENSKDDAEDGELTPEEEAYVSDEAFKRLAE